MQRAGQRSDAWLALLLVLLAAGAIVGALAAASSEGARWLHYVCKPAATLVIIARAARGGAGAYRRWVLTGLWLSLVGDICLMLPMDAFVPGLAAFLLAHLAYVMALRRGLRVGGLMVSVPLLAVYAVGNLAGLWPHLPGDLRVPVVAYTVVLAGMAALALGRGLVPPAGEQGRARLAGVGAVLFVASDSLLAWDRFAGPLPWAIVGVLGSYYAAQWCIAGSVGFRRK
ncbi:MAG TPA: lysoplasmalogenase [Stenotrophomonas sp.]|nr:lysoplasmalogenase [Stenotrophomonas sp.]